MLNKEKLEDVLSHINKCSEQLLALLHKCGEEYVDLGDIYRSNIINCENSYDKSFLENCHKSIQCVSDLCGVLSDNLSSLEKDAIKSANSWFEIIPTAFK